MSGLCGICHPGREVAGAILAAMLERVSLPDETQRKAVSSRGTALGVSSRWPTQEVASVDGILVALDGDLLNLAEPSSPPQQNLPPNKASAAERVARLYLQHGPSFVKRLQGTFSIALWDERAQRLLLAIDHLGVKSLYWAKEGDRLIFASRAGAVRSAQERPAQVNPAAVMQFLLFSVVPAPLVIYQGMTKLQPGFCLIYDQGQVREERYWDLEYLESENHDERYWAQEVREGLRAAVHRHLEGCLGETTGAYLSGGTDSSSVVAFMAERFSPVNTFSIYFPETHYSEIGFARSTAGHFRTRHHERCLSSADAREAIPRIVEYYDEPFANSSAIGAYSCARMARENGIETLLAGDGGDELFGGNERYASDKRFALYHALPRWLRGVLEPAVKLLPRDGGKLSLPRRYIDRARIPNPRRIFSYGLFLSDTPGKVFEPGFLAQVPPEEWMEIADGHFQGAQASSELNRLLYLDLKLILADNDLRKVSGTAELAGVRVRYPLLDRRLAELAARIPTRLKLKGFAKRYIFKKAMTGILPHEVIYKKKHGFGVPLGHWFLDDPQLSSFVREVLNDPRTRQRGYFRPGFFAQLMDQHQREHAAYYGEIVWHLVALELWHRQHLESHREVAHVR